MDHAADSSAPFPGDWLALAAMTVDAATGRVAAARSPLPPEQRRNLLAVFLAIANKWAQDDLLDDAAADPPLVDDGLPPGLSGTKREILRRWRAGQSVPDIARALDLARKTVQNHIYTARKERGVELVPRRR